MSILGTLAANAHTVGGSFVELARIETTAPDVVYPEIDLGNMQQGDVFDVRVRHMVNASLGVSINETYNYQRVMNDPVISLRPIPMAENQTVILEARQPLGTARAADFALKDSNNVVTP